MYLNLYEFFFSFWPTLSIFSQQTYKNTHKKQHIDKKHNTQTKKAQPSTPKTHNTLTKKHNTDTKNTTHRQKTQLIHLKNTIKSRLIMYMFSTLVKFLQVHSYENDIFSLFHPFISVCMLINKFYSVIFIL